MRGLVAVLAALLLSQATLLPAQAADADDVKRAREHHTAGDQAFKDGRYLDAYREWEAGYALSPRPLFLVNMAHAERRRGELNNARTLYRKFLLMDPQSRLRVEVESVLAEIDAALAGAPAAPLAPEPPAVAPPAVEPAPPPPASLLGSPTEPAIGPPPIVSAELPREPPPSPPLYRRWWFWTGVGVVAAAAGGASFFLLRGPGYTRSGSLGTVGAP